MLDFDSYEKEERDIIKKCETEMLSELLYLNYKYKNSEYYETNGTYLYNSMQDQIIYTDKEAEELKGNAIKLFENKYKIKIRRFDDLIYEDKK